MITVTLNIQDEAYEKVMYLIDSLPKKDIKVVKKTVIEEIDPTLLDKDDFDYISKDELDKIDKEIEDAKKEGFDKLKSYEELKNELQTHSS